MTALRLPNITATTDKGQLQQLRSYLYQLAQELNWALGTIDTKAREAAQAAQAVPKPDGAQQAKATFAEVKALIIKSADIVNAYYEEVSRRLEGRYVAQSDFGTYTQETAATLQANAESLGVLFENQQALEMDVAGVQGVLRTDADGVSLVGARAWCKVGVLDYEESGFPIYGMEIGQTNDLNGQTLYQKYAQYRSDGVHLFDQNGVEVATVSDRSLRITHAQMDSADITGRLTLGGYSLNTDNGIAISWQG